MEDEEKDTISVKNKISKVIINRVGLFVELTILYLARIINIVIHAVSEHIDEDSESIINHFVTIVDVVG